MYVYIPYPYSGVFPLVFWVFPLEKIRDVGLALQRANIPG